MISPPCLLQAQLPCYFQNLVWTTLANPLDCSYHLPQNSFAEAHGWHFKECTIPSLTGLLTSFRVSWKQQEIILQELKPEILL